MARIGIINGCLDFIRKEVVGSVSRKIEAIAMQSRFFHDVASGGAAMNSLAVGDKSAI